MANTRNGNVWFVDTDNTVLPGPLKITGIKYIGAATSSASLKAGTTAGPELWRETATSNVFDEVEIICNEQAGVHVDLTGTAVIFIYLE
jgi:hypothetical protein